MAKSATSKPLKNVLMRNAPTAEGHKDLDVTRLAAHKDALACKLISTLQMEMADYVKKFNAAFKAVVATISGKIKLTTDEVRILRGEFFDSYEKIYPLPIYARLPESDKKFVEQILNIDYKKAIADYCYDGLVPGCMGGSTLFSTQTFIIVANQLIGKNTPLHEIAEQVGIKQDHYCHETKLDREQSSWTIAQKASERKPVTARPIPKPFKPTSNSEPNLLQLAAALASMSDADIKDREECQVHNVDYNKKVDGPIVKRNDDGTVWVYQAGGSQTRPVLQKVPLEFQPPGISLQFLHHVSFTTVPDPRQKISKGQSADKKGRSSKS